jgi:1-acyl-sn-glycerol-3-phosphate acyltransferase
VIDPYLIWYPLLRTGLRLVFHLCGGFRVEGAEHVPSTGGVLLVANHVSYADPPALGAAAPRPTWFMAKEPLFRSPVLRWVLRIGRAFPVDQEGIDRRALRRAHDLLMGGEVVIIFPEGGTSPSGELQPFFPGFAVIAQRAAVPVVPVALIGTNRVVPYDRLLPRTARGGVLVRFGPPLDLTGSAPGLDRRERLDWAVEHVRGAIAGMLGKEG